MKRDTSAGKPEEEKFTLIDSLITAMFVPKEYNKLLKLSVGKITRYVFVVLLLVCLIRYAVPVLGSIAGLGGMEGILMNETPQFALEDGKFSYEEKVEQIDEVSRICLIVDTTVDEYTKEDVPANMLQAVLVSENNMLVYNSLYGMGAMVESQRFEDLKELTITNQTVADMSGFLYAGLMFLFVVVWFASIIEYLLMAFFYGGITYVFLKALIPNLKFGTAYKTAVFAQTIGLIVESVTYSLGIETLYMAGGFFNVLVTVSLMNKVLVRFKINDKL